MNGSDFKASFLLRDSRVEFRACRLRDLVGLNFASASLHHKGVSVGVQTPYLPSSFLCLRSSLLEYRQSSPDDIPNAQPSSVACRPSEISNCGQRRCSLPHPRPRIQKVGSFDVHRVSRTSRSLIEVLISCMDAVESLTR